MNPLTILTYPDTVLRSQSEEIVDFIESDFQTLVDNLLQTLASQPYCVGIAAPQTGHLLKLLIINGQNARKPPENHHGLLIICNPEILQWSGMDVAREGCLSLPDHTGNVVRAVNITVGFQDRYGQGCVLKMSGFEARVMQHEIDHLEGKLFTDRIVSRKADLFRRKVRTQKSMACKTIGEKTDRPLTLKKD